MSRKSRWINTRVVIDIASGAVLERKGFLYDGPIAHAEGKTPEQIAAEAAAAVDAANKAKDEAINESAKLRKQIAELSGKVMTPEQQKEFDDLKAAAAKAEEDRLKKAGDFEKLTAQLTDKHAKDLEAASSRTKSLEATLRKTLVGREFAAAAALFGKEGKTILTPAIAEAYYGRFVEVQDVEGSDDKIVVVKNTSGQVILDPKTGKPMAFADAMNELIDGMPDKDSVLRGSGKTGSGSAGGGHHNSGSPEDLDQLTKKAAAGDKDAISKLRERQQGLGGAIQGTAYAAARSK